MRLKHLHQDGTAAGMFGMARPSGGGTRRWYRCGAARATETTTATCDGLGVVNRQEMTSVQADLVEALTLQWILTQEPEAWKALYEQALEAAEVASFDIEEGEKRIAHLEVTITRIKDGFDSGLYKADEAAQRSAGYLAEIEGIEEDIKQAHQRGDDLALRGLTIGELMGIEIEDHDGFEYEPDEYPLMASERREELLIAVATTLGTPDRYGRTPGLPEHARNEVERLARLLDVVVYIGRNDDDPRRPRYLVDFSPEGALTLEGLKQGGSSAGSQGVRGSNPLSSTSEEIHAIRSQAGEAHRTGTRCGRP